jgi:acyl carrier protein
VTDIENNLIFLKECISELKGISINEIEIDQDTDLSELGLDSLDIVELQMMYEEKTGVSLDDVDEPVGTIKDLLELLK